MERIENVYYADCFPRVSVITPIYNRADTILRAVKSLDIQTYKNFEMIMVDDGSTDNIDEVILPVLNNLKFPILYLKKNNGGVHTARNLAIKHARGELTLFLDSDDEILPCALERLLEIWDSIPINRRHEYREVVAQCVDQFGNRVGLKFPDNINDMSKEEAIKQCDMTRGEHFAILLTQPLKDNPWPEPEGVKLVTEDIVWKVLEKKYRSYYVNDMLRVYHTDTNNSLVNNKNKSVQWYINWLFNNGYMLNNYKVYRSKKSNRIKMIILYNYYYIYLKKVGNSYRYGLTGVNLVLSKLLMFPTYILLKLMRKL